MPPNMVLELPSCKKARKNNMGFRFNWIFLFTLLLASMVIARPENFSSDRNVHKRQKRDAVETSSCKQEIEKCGMSLFNYGIDKLTTGTVNPIGDFFGSLKSVYDIIQADRNTAKMRIGEGLKNSFPNSTTTFETKDVNQLESALVYIYTDDNIYPDLNAALRQHDCTYKALTLKDKDMAAYATALLTTLLYWESLPEYTKTTYRVFGSLTNINEALKKYELGSTVVFPAFTSSAVSPLPQFANSDENILLEIDNSQPSFWTPTDIAKLSRYPSETELLYPSLAEFKVMSKPENETDNGKVFYKIRLQLQGDAASLDAASMDPASPVQGSRHLQFIPALLAWVYM
uniref:NAD(P)(+)--arginine ADP-ribosyltransferase n=1 Tax=Crassostrea virginica TaxID=6565 RepID=A0A8B8AXZ0_CRAVI|nr:uncharacterized protein LOC111105848 [Crassostrea virginica]